ncbi:Tautomerase/MIF superfamily [Collybia nuda]|uniref:L-dopachrome isomerase n=1 Tax=Collybia nuda TaxID=64659 RepID=A0A9P5YE93_9AGAR|nr:Tautomerase/MIF superfamily [Collybia nuda]
MPSLELTTNVKVDDPKAFALEFSKLGAATLGKPEGYITVSVTYNPTLTFAGTFDPAFTMTVVSLDNLNDSANEGYSKKFFDFFKEKLAVPGDRGYITFMDPGRGFLGHQGTTFATIFAK